MKPSTTTGFCWAAAASTTPAMPPISKPPTLASTSRPSRGSGRLTARAASTTAILRANWPSSMPVPRPVTSATGGAGQRGHHGRGGRGVGDAHVAGAEHVGLRRPATRRLRCPPRRPGRPAAGSWPARGRCWPCRGRLFFEMILPAATSGPRSAATPMSTTTTRAPASRPRALMPAMPAANPWTICAVTSCGYLLTPSAATP